jgi:hypothetical protein
MRQAEFEQVVGVENICGNIRDALERAEELQEEIETKSATGERLG